MRSICKLSFIYHGNSPVVTFPNLSIIPAFRTTIEANFSDITDLTMSPRSVIKYAESMIRKSSEWKLFIVHCYWRHSHLWNIQSVEYWILSMTYASIERYCVMMASIPMFNSVGNDAPAGYWSRSHCTALMCG